MSRMSAVRSITFTPRPTSSSSLLCCEGLSSSSKITTSMSILRTIEASSSALPLPMKVRGLGASRRWLMVKTVSAPAVCARRSSSAKDSSAGTAAPGRSMPTSTARSGTSAVSTSNSLRATPLPQRPSPLPPVRRAFSHSDMASSAMRATSPSSASIQTMPRCPRSQVRCRFA